MIVTPAIAREWLDRNNTNNRPVSRARVNVLRKVIADGNWHVTHQGIAFYEDGSLADGQHRLEAIAAGATPVGSIVTFGLSRELIHAIDTGRPRSVANVLNFIGMRISSGSVAACRAMWNDYYAYRNKTTWASQSVAIDTNRFSVFCGHVEPAVSFACPTHKRRGLAHASVTAAIASAWFTQDRTALERFKELLHVGAGANEDEVAAIRLREFLLTTSISSGGAESRQEIYLRSCTALRAFLEGRGISKLYCRVESRFPIPDCQGL
jgi:hypothetical protein